MNCNKRVLTYFYGDEDNKSSRTPIIKELREWAKNYKEAKNKYENEFKPHRLISGAYKIGKTKTIERSLNKLNGKYLFINEKTKIDKLDEFALQLKDHFFSRKKPSKVLRKAFEDEVRKFLEINDRKRFYDKLLAFLSLIQEIKRDDPQIRIIFVYESKSQLDTELFDALINSGVRFIFKIKVTPKELLDDDDSLAFGSLLSLSHHLKLKRLSLEESVRMIRGDHPEVKKGVCGITEDIVKKFFSKVDSSIEDLIINIVGCHPYLICELCGKIIDEINSFSDKKVSELEELLLLLIRNDRDNYDMFFNNFFGKIKEYRNDLFKAYRNWIVKEIIPKEDQIHIMNMFGMIFEKDKINQIPLLFKEYILKGSVKDFNMSSLKRKNPVKKILILATNPKDTRKKRFDEEVREIEESLRRSRCRVQFKINSVLAVQRWDLRRALLDHKPQIVYFTGYGKEGGIVVEDKLGMSESISSKAFSELIELCAEHVECVILSTSYSEPEAAAISKHIDYVIGMRSEIEDKATIEFAVGFYDALGDGKSVEEAFKFGCNAIKLSNLSEYLIPILKKKNPGKKQ